MRGSRMGEGRQMFSATDAMGHGLVDKIQAPREFYRSVVPVEEQPKAPVNYGLAHARARIDLAKARF